VSQVPVKAAPVKAVPSKALPKKEETEDEDEDEDDESDEDESEDEKVCIKIWHHYIFIESSLLFFGWSINSIVSVSFISHLSVFSDL
jgi:hypothetical protein